MFLWERINEVSSLVFLISNRNSNNHQLVRFYLSLPMGFIDLALLFFMSMETSTNLVNVEI